MKRAEQQLTIPGIGQQLADLDWWKKETGVYTQEIKGIAWNTEGFVWGAWSGFESPVIFICQNQPDDMGYGDTEREAILAYCEKANIDKPFWW